MAPDGHLEPIDPLAHGKVHASLGTGAAAEGSGTAATTTTDPTEDPATVALRGLW